MNAWTGCFDPDSMVEGLDDGVSQVLKPSTLMVGSHNSSAENLKLSTEELSYQYSNTRREEPASAAMELQLQNQRMAFNTHLMKDSSDQPVAFPSSSFPNSFISFMNPTHTTPLSDLQRTDTLDASHRRFGTEVERRREMQDKYQTLRNLIPNPNPTKVLHFHSFSISHMILPLLQDFSSSCFLVGNLSRLWFYLLWSCLLKFHR